MGLDTHTEAHSLQPGSQINCQTNHWCLQIIWRILQVTLSGNISSVNLRQKILLDHSCDPQPKIKYQLQSLNLGTQCLQLQNLRAFIYEDYETAQPCGDLCCLECSSIQVAYFNSWKEIPVGLDTHGSAISSARLTNKMPKQALILSFDPQPKKNKTIVELKSGHSVFPTQKNPKEVGT